MILFIALLYIGMVIACIATTPLTVVRFSYPTTFVLFGILYYFLVNVVGKYARCKAQQPLFRQNSIP